jgi:predicted homoserine dehydrogenase-like protein
VLKIKKNADIEDEGRWFEYGNSGARFKIRIVTSSILKTLRKRASKIRTEFKAGKTTRVEDVNEELFETLIQEHILEAWEGVGDEAGELLAITEENKHVIFQNLELNTFLWECSKSLEIEDEVKAENFTG